jgi:GNAT superfamily N-acetyltransferase
MELREARPADLSLAARWLGLEGVPGAWASDLEVGTGLVLEAGGAPVAMALLRDWGRVMPLSALVTDPERRGSGLGSRLLEAVREEWLRRDCRVAGLELAVGEDEAALAFLLRRGFKLAPPLLLVELDLPRDGETGAEERAVAVGPDALDALAASLDAGFDPLPWMQSRVARGAALVALPGETGVARAVALAEPPTDGGEAAVSLALLDEAEPFPSLPELLGALSGAGVARASFAVPSRQSDALRALLQAGGVLAGLRLRLCLAGFPERSDLRRAVLAPWR